jgi:hypothetical protein
MILTSYPDHMGMLEYAPSPSRPATLTVTRTFLQVYTSYERPGPGTGWVEAGTTNAQVCWRMKCDGNVYLWSWPKETA